jgi:hypothetical protein
MTVADFLENVSGPLTGASLTSDDLVEIYNSIKSEPFTFKNTDGDQMLALCAPRLKGELEKKSSAMLSRWTKHFFVLSQSCLYYFANGSQHMADPEPLGVIQLISVLVEPLRQTELRISGIASDLQYVKFRPHRPASYCPGIKWMLFRAVNTAVRDKWLYRIKTSVVFLNFTGEPHPEASGIDVSTAGEAEEEPEMPGSAQIGDWKKFESVGDEEARERRRSKSVEKSDPTTEKETVGSPIERRLSKTIVSPVRPQIGDALQPVTLPRRSISEESGCHGSARVKKISHGETFLV